MVNSRSNQEWDYDLARVAVKFVGSHVSKGEAIKSWLTNRRLLPHIARDNRIFC